MDRITNKILFNNFKNKTCQWIPESKMFRIILSLKILGLENSNQFKYLMKNVIFLKIFAMNLKIQIPCKLSNRVRGNRMYY